MGKNDKNRNFSLYLMKKIADNVSSGPYAGHYRMLLCQENVPCQVTFLGLPACMIRV